MKQVERSEIQDYVTYDENRESFRAKIMRVKGPRRIHVGDHVTLLFENRNTIRYQIQEMIRAERIVKEANIKHEIDTYNELLGGPGEFGCTLLIEIADPETRKRRLREWLQLPEKVYVRLEDGSKVRATFDERQRGAEQVSSVQYLKFDTGGQVPVAAGVDMPELSAETSLNEEQRAALASDLSS